MDSKSNESEEGYSSDDDSEALKRKLEAISMNTDAQKNKAKKR